MTRDEFISANPIESVLERIGTQLSGNGAQKKAKCPFHQDKNASLSVNVVTGTWHCHAGCGGGSVIDLIAKHENTDAVTILKRETTKQDRPAIEQKGTKEASKQDKIYQYRDERGNDVYQVVRMIPKSFRQRHLVNDTWVWKMDGVTRVLYRLPEILSAEEVWIVEGEKDADNLAKLGFQATCNTGGAGKWMSAYTESLEGKKIVLCGDNDDPGRKHMNDVFESLSGKASEVRTVKMPTGIKDVSDFIAMNDDAKAKLQAMRDSAACFIKGVDLPLKKFWELENSYVESCKSIGNSGYKFGSWLPGFSSIRPLIPGELAMIIGGTGVGKTAILSNIANSARNMRTIFFELELPEELMFERLAAMRSKMQCSMIEQCYASGEKLGQEVCDKHFPNLYICTKPRLSVKQLQKYIELSELKIGEKPQLILLDYVGLIGGDGGDKYEKVSNIAEDLKVMAKETGTIVIASSQIKRKDPENPEVTLYDAKDSGSIENSCGLMIGAWKNAENRELMHLKVLKNTKGTPGLEVVCKYDAPVMSITQVSVMGDE